MTYTADYPDTVAEVLTDDTKYKRGVIEAVKAYAEAGAWTGDRNARIAKMQVLLQCLSEVYNIPCPSLYYQRGTDSNGVYNPSQHSITLIKRLSVLTLLHEFAHALGKGERGACKWSINLFRRCFPEQYVKLSPDGHTLRKGGMTT